VGGVEGGAPVQHRRQVHHQIQRQAGERDALEQLED
jgi:hypothetical protein